MLEQPLIYESILEMFCDTDWRKRYTKQEIREMNKRISCLDSADTMRIIGDLTALFMSFYDTAQCGRSLSYYDKESREIHCVADLILENRDFEMLVKVKMVLDEADVRRYIERKVNELLETTAQQQRQIDGLKRELEAIKR